MVERPGGQGGLGGAPAAGRGDWTPVELGAGGGRLPGKQGIVTAVSEEHHSVHAVGSPTQGRGGTAPPPAAGWSSGSRKDGARRGHPEGTPRPEEQAGPRTSQQDARLQLEESLAPPFAATGAARGPGT